MRIRKCRTKKAQRAAQLLERQLFPETPAYESANAIWWIVEDETGPCAFAVLTPLVDEPGVAYLARTGVVSRARGRGLQRRLVRLREAEARKLGIETLLTYTDYDNIRSANNLIACGFKLYVPHYKFGWSNSYYFKKDLK